MKHSMRRQALLRERVNRFNSYQPMCAGQIFFDLEMGHLIGWPTTSRHQRGYGTAHDKMRKELLERVVLCEECTRNGRVRVGPIADHIIPLAKAGTGDRSNYQLLCDDCSEAKGLIDKGLSANSPGVDRSGRRISPDHPWIR
jgi:5-methylcytosine-specific restriction protein A